MASAILLYAINPPFRSLLDEFVERGARLLIKVLTKARGIVKRHLLHVKDPKLIPVAEQLKWGDELCRERKIPMSSQLIEMVTQIYDNCDHGDITDSYCENDNRDVPLFIWRMRLQFISVIEEVMRRFNPSRDHENRESDTPLMKALDLGLMDMVWGFIECAKQTNSNILTHETGDDAVQEFLWLRNIKNGKTAFDVAIARKQLEVASLLLNDAPLSCLASQFNRRAKTLLPLVNKDSKFDRIIFDMLENESREEGNLPTSNQIHDDSRQESIIDTEGITNLQTSYPQLQPERNETLEVLIDRHNDLLGKNPSKNSVLHLVSKFGDVKYVKEILEKHPSMISCRNSNGETPAYVAASEGHADILQTMFQCIKEENEDMIKSIVTRETDKNNALHIAIQNHHVEVVFLLIKEIPQLANSINNFKESPLYVAAERKYFGILDLMLKTCREIAFMGPNGKTALHAAAISDSPECIKYLLKERCYPLNVKDDYGWKPFDCAVYHNSSLAVAELLNVDNSIGYELIIEDGINTSAIHKAASRGHFETMKVLMFKCLGCSEFIDSKGRNILHVAVENKKEKVIEYIFQEESLTRLINQRDRNGNTPIHMLVVSDFEMMEKVMDFRVDLNVLNNEKQTPLDKTSSHNQRERLIKRMAMGTSIQVIKKHPWSANQNKYDRIAREYGDKEKESEAKKGEAEARFKIAENLVVVAALIATASFAAGIRLPSDDYKEGTAFRVFIATDAIAFSSSCAVLLIYVRLLMYRNQYIEDSLANQEYVNNKIVDMYLLTAVALLLMAIAFLTGVYVVLSPFIQLSIPLCALSVLTIWLSVRVDIDL